MPVPFKKDPEEYNQRKLMAENAFDLLPPDDDCFVYEDIFSQIDKSQLEKKYSMLGQHAYHPRLIVAILIYAYSQGIFSSRKIENKCRKDLSFMYISHLNCPNFRVLSDFRKDNWQFFKSCFCQSVAIAKSLGMVSLGHVSLDGFKFYANTSKYKAVSYKRLNEAYAKLEEEIEDLLKKADDTDSSEDRIYHNGKGYSVPEDIKIKKKRLAKIKRVKKALEERERKEKLQEDIKDSSQISYADTEAKLMKARGNFEYCYNGQISVDEKNQIIISEHLSRNENDKNELKPAIDEMIEAGVDAVVGVDPVMDKTMDLKSLKQKAQGKICLWGGVNQALTVELGDESGIKDAVKEAITVLGKDGGFILSPVENVIDMSEDVWKKVIMFIEAWKDLR